MKVGEEATVTNIVMDNVKKYKGTSMVDDVS